MYNPFIKRLTETPKGFLPPKPDVPHWRAKTMAYLIRCTVDTMRKGVDPEHTLDHELHIAINSEITRQRLSLTMEEYAMVVKFALQTYKEKRFTEDPDKRYSPSFHEEYRLFKQRR